MKKFAFAVTAVFVCLMTSNAAGNENVPTEDNMETITVSATPIALSDAGSSITVITREEIERRNTSIQSLL